MKILFFRLGAIGDTLLTTPALMAARQLFPDAEIHYLAGEAASKVLENNPHIDKLFVQKKIKTFLPRDFEALAQAKFLKKNFGNVVYDYFIDFESSPFSAILSLYIKARVKIGHIILRKRKFLFNIIYNRRVDHKDGDFYVIHRHLALVKVLGQFENTDNSLVLKLTEQEKTEASAFYKSAGIEETDKKILLSISSTWKTKEWPAQYWQRLADMIGGQVKSAKIIVLWAPGDPENLKSRLAAISNVTLIPQTTLRQMAAIISFGNVMIANDGAARHIGVALGLKTVGLFGPTNEKGWAFADARTILLRPPEGFCEPCHRAKCGKKPCMEQITPEEAAKAVVRLL